MDGGVAAVFVQTAVVEAEQPVAHTEAVGVAYTEAEEITVVLAEVPVVAEVSET